MANASINAVYNKLLKVEKEIHEMRAALIPEVRLSEKELKEIRKELARSIQEVKGLFQVRIGNKVEKQEKNKILL